MLTNAEFQIQMLQDKAKQALKFCEFTYERANLDLPRAALKMFREFYDSRADFSVSDDVTQAEYEAVALPIIENALWCATLEYVDHIIDTMEKRDNPLPVDKYVEALQAARTDKLIEAARKAVAQ